MEEFSLKNWHVVAFVSAICVGMIKDTIAKIIANFLYIIENDFKEGEVFEIESSSGGWVKVEFIRYSLPFPCSRGYGGLMIRHLDNDAPFIEDISFDLWSGMRLRRFEK